MISRRGFGGVCIFGFAKALRVSCLVVIIACFASADDNVGSGRDLPILVHHYLNNLEESVYVSEPRLRAKIGDPNERTERELSAARSVLQRLGKRVDQNWIAIQEIREMRKPLATADPGIAFLRISSLLRERDAELERLQEIENEQCYAAHGQHVYGWLAVDTPKANAAREKWLQSKAHANFVARQESVKQAYQARLENLINNYKNNTDETEKAIDQLQQSVLTSFQVVNRWTQRVEKALEKRRQGIPPGPSVSESQTTSGPLTVDCPLKEFTMTTTDTVTVNLRIKGGKPPYRVTVKTLSGENDLQTTLSQRGATPVPFAFGTEGLRTANVILEDESHPRQQARLTLEFRVIDESEGEPEEWPATGDPPKGKTGEQTPKPPKQPSSTTPPKQPSTPPNQAGTKPPRLRLPLAPGVYRAHLRVRSLVETPGGSWVKAAEFGPEDTSEPYPFHLTVDAAGHISGRCDHVFPKAKFNNVWGDDEVYWDTSFTLSGKADWQTGEVELSIRDWTVFAFAKDPPHEHGYRIEYRADLKGWRVPGPVKPLLKMYHKELTARFGRAMLLGVWPITIDGTGGYRIDGEGWTGFGKHEDAGVIPTRDSTVDLVSYTSYRVYKDERTEKDETEHRRRKGLFQPKYRGTATWSLRILGRVSDDISGLGGELVGSLGVWPVKPRAWPPSPIRVKVGDVVELAAYGVVAPRYFETTDLTNKAKWIARGGLNQLGNGKFKATQAGTAFVRAGVKTAGEWSRGTVKIIIEPAAETRE